jgi:hypothetical protein
MQPLLHVQMNLFASPARPPELIRPPDKRCDAGVVLNRRWPKIPYHNGVMTSDTCCVLVLLPAPLTLW